MASVVLKNVFKKFPGGVVAVSDFTIDIQDKEFIILVGPSGCGKTTTLRMIAGLEDITSGELYIGDKLCNDVAPKDRDIAMVFQNYALYPHMTVFDNMAFGLKLRKTPKTKLREEYMKQQEFCQLNTFLIENQRLYQVDKDSVLLLVVLLFVSLKCSSWTSLFQTSMPSSEFR